MNINEKRLLYDIEESLLKEQYRIDDYKQFVERRKTVDCKEYASVSVMVANICTSYIGTDTKVLQSIYKTTRKAVVKILSHDDNLCQEYFFVGKYIIAFFNTPQKVYIDEVLDYSALLNATITAISRMVKVRYGASLSVNIGIEFGRVLRINEHINRYTTKETFHGYPINNAILYSDLDIDADNGNIVISENVRRNLKEEYKAFFKNYKDKYFVAKVYNTEAINWIKEKYPDDNERQG